MKQKKLSQTFKWIISTSTRPQVDFHGEGINRVKDCKHKKSTDGGGFDPFIRSGKNKNNASLPVNMIMNQSFCWTWNNNRRDMGYAYTSETDLTTSIVFCVCIWYAYTESLHNLCVGYAHFFPFSLKLKSFVGFIFILFFSKWEPWTRPVVKRNLRIVASSKYVHPSH